VKRLLILIAKALAAVGVFRRRFHVDAGAQVRIRATVGGAGGAPLPQATVALERPPAGRERGPYRAVVGQTDSAGQIDVTVFWRWSYETRRMDAPPPVPTTFVVISKAGLAEIRIPVSLTTAATSASVVQIDLGQIRMT
jgi:hypothetical protein